jgi:hypothetical protein
VLREAGFVESTVDATALERHLNRLDQSTPTKRKTRREDD